MNIGKKLKGLLAACVAAVGLTAFAEPTVTVDKVETYQPWSKIAVFYTLGGTDGTLNYKVAFDVTADGRTTSVTNGVMTKRPADGAERQVIDTVALFGEKVADPQAKVKVTLIAINPKTQGVQLWADGPFWAETNLGESGDPDHPEYGASYTFANADAAVKSLLGQEWRLPSKAEFEKLNNTSYCTRTWDDLRKGWTFTGATEGYTDKSICLPTTGSTGEYWTPEATGWYDTMSILRIAATGTSVTFAGSSDLLSVRAVR